MALSWTWVPVGGGHTDSNVLHIGGIFPIGGQAGWQGGQACMPAARLALEDVNARKDLLPGYVLKLHSNDSEVSYNQPQHGRLLLHKCTGTSWSNWNLQQSSII